MKHNDNSGPAFPVLPPVGPDGQTPPGYPYPDGGMTLRDWFAGLAMHGLLSGPGSNDQRAAFAYQQADAMLKARGSR
jgi:hypothetical protein